MSIYWIKRKPGAGTAIGGGDVVDAVCVTPPETEVYAYSIGDTLILILFRSAFNRRPTAQHVEEI